MRGWVKEFLDAVPTTGPANVVSLEPRDPCEPPRAWCGLYRAIMERRQRIAQIEADKAEHEAAHASATALHQQLIARIERDLATEGRKLAEDQTCIVTMCGNLGIHIEDDPQITDDPVAERSEPRATGEG